MKWSTSQALNFNFMIAVAVILINAVLTTSNLRNLRSNNRWVLHTVEVMRQLERTRTLLWRAAAAPAHDGTSLEAVYQSVDSVSKLTADNPRQQKLVAGLRASVSAVRQSTVPLEARRVIEKMHAEEERLLKVRSAASQKVARKTFLTFGVASVLGLALVGVSHYLTRFSILERMRTEAKFRGLMESAPDAMVIVDATGRIVLVNSQTEAIFGYRREELYGRQLDVLVPGRLRDGQPADQPGSSDDPWPRPVRHGREPFGLRKDGSEFPIEITLSPLETEAGILVSSAIRDVTLRKREEETLARQARLLDVTHDSIIVRGMDGLISFWNHGAEVRYGWSKEDAMGQITHELLRTEFPKPLNEVEEEVVRAGKWEGELVHATRDGARLVVASRWVLLRDGEGRPVAVLEINNDITERKIGEEMLRQRTTELEAANKELEAFSYSVSHDLRAPLRSLDGFSRILLEEYAGGLPDDAQGYLQSVRNNAQKMGRLVDDLLGFARLGRLPIRKQAVDAASIVRQSFEELLEQEDGRKVEFTVGDLPRCRAEPVLLKQVWTNLISNALKYTRGQDVARIEVGSGSEDGQLYYFITDNGVGFDMKYADKLFGVFSRLHRAEDYEGTGVGLAIVHRVVQRHGGRVWAEAQPGKGAAFYFSIGGCGRD